jgi:hypothetical protein
MGAVFTVGQYNLISWALNSFGVPLDRGSNFFLATVHLLKLYRFKVFNTS